MAALPAAAFYDKDLARRFPDEFVEAKKDKLIHRVPRGRTYDFEVDRPRTVIPDDNGMLEAYDPDDPDAEPLTLSADALTRWRVDLFVLAKRFQLANELRGSAETFRPRLHFLGDLERNGARLGFFLGFFLDDASCLQHVATLPSLVSRDYDRFVVACPAFIPTPTTRTRLESINIFVVPLGTVDPFALDYERVLVKPPRKIPRVVLSTREEGEFQRRGFRSRLHIRLTGRTTGRASNLVEVAGRAVEIGDVPFSRFLRLVLGVFETNDGYLLLESANQPSLAGEGLFDTEGIDQAISRLRSMFKGYLADLKDDDFIERHRGRIRLSTHRRFITYDRLLLLGHHDARVKEYAARLPQPPRSAPIRTRAAAQGLGKPAPGKGQRGALAPPGS